MQTRRALLIGINDYQHIIKLGGCLNDVAEMEDIFVNRFGFQHVTKLLNQNATRAGILGAFQQLVRDTKRDDVVVIYFAGHGSQIKDAEGDEPSGMDSTLMPVDTFGSLGKPEQNLDITDDEIHLFLLDLAAQTQFITLIIDACHSGSITRDAEVVSPDVIERGMPADTRAPAIQRLTTDQVARLGVGNAMRGEASPSGWMSSSPEGKYVLIAGCRDEQLSGELKIQLKDGTWKSRGAMSYYLADELRAAAPGDTYRDVYERTAAKVTAFRNGRQHPQLEGRADRVLFGVDELVPMKYLEVTARVKDARTFTIAGGASMGLTVGSKVSVFPQGTKSLEGSASVGAGTITAVDAISSEATIDSEAGAGIAVGARAVITQLNRDATRLTVSITGESPLGDEITKAAELKLVPDTEPAVLRVKLGENGKWYVRGADGTVVLPVLERDDWKTVAANIVTYSRFRYALELENTDPYSDMRKKFELRLFRQLPNQEWEEAMPGPSGMPELTHGDVLGVKIKSNYHKDAYITLLGFGLSGRIKSYYPLANAKPTISPGVEFPLFMEPRGQRLRYRIPEQFPFVPSTDGDQQLEGIEALKLFVSSGPANYDFLEQEGFTAPKDVTRDGDLEGPSGPVDEWTTVTRTFLLRQPRAASTSAEAPAKAGFATVITPGVAVEARWGNEAKESLREDPGAAALAAEGFILRQTLSIKGDQGATRDAAPATVDVALAPPPEGYGQVILATDADGVSRWHYPVAAPATRDASAVPLQHFSIPLAPAPQQESQERAAGVVTAIAMAQVFMFLAKPVAAAVGQWGFVQYEGARRPYRVRAVSSSNIGRADVPELDEAGWERLSKGRALLLLHNEWRQTSGSFAELPAHVLAALEKKYEDRIFAFDHFTLGHDPLRNAQEFIERMPKNVVVNADVIAYSRGGLVARTLADGVDGFSLNGRQLSIGKVVLLATPSGGTELATEQQIGNLADVATNAVKKLKKIGDMGGTIAELVKHLAMGIAGGVPGIVSMSAGSPFLTKLASAKPSPTATYYAIGSEFTPRNAELSLLFAQQASTKLLGGPNDLMVPSKSTWASAESSLPEERRRLLVGRESESHFNLLDSEIVQNQLLTWLEASPT